MSPRSGFFAVGDVSTRYQLAGRRIRPSTATGARPSAAALGWQSTSGESFEPRMKRPDSAHGRVQEALIDRPTSLSSNSGGGGGIIRPSTAPQMRSNKGVAFSANMELGSNSGSSLRGRKDSLMPGRPGSPGTTFERQWTGISVMSSRGKLQPAPPVKVSLSLGKVTSSSRDVSVHRYCDMSGLELKEIPGYLCQRVNITVLILSDNNLEELPEELWQLKFLQLLDVDNNNIKELFEKVVTLTNLHTLSVCNNLLRSLPKRLHELKNLRELMFTSNKIREICDNDAKFPNLTVSIIFLLLAHCFFAAFLICGMETRFQNLHECGLSLSRSL